jgi:hypothetical protein
MILEAWTSGWKRVLAAPAVAGGVFVITALIALPLAFVMRGTIASHLGDSLMAAQAADGVNWDWWQEFSAQASGIGTTFTPSVIGFAATLDSLSALLDARALAVPIAFALAFYIAGWALLSAGIIDRYARQRPTRAHGFFSVAGGYLFRFIRLAALVGLVYWWLFAYVHPWLFGRLYVDLTRNLSVERTAFLWRLAFYALFGGCLVLVNVLSDYARIRIVVEDRRSVLGGLSAAWRFIWRHRGNVLALYLLNSAVFVAAVAMWLLVAPGAGSAGAGMWLTFVFTQLYVVIRLLMKLQFLASQIVMFQGHLAHARYTAEPAPVWPDSAAAEAITRSVRLPDHRSRGVGG